MDWTQLIIALLSGGFVASAVEMFRYRKQNKQLKDNEAAQSTVETQEKEINLANLYKQEMLKLFEEMKRNQTENVGNQKEMMESLSNLDKRLDNLESRMHDMETNVGNISRYLNGGLSEFMEGQKRKAEESARKRKKA